MTVFADAYDTATPAGSDDPAEADDNMRRIQDAVQQRENVDHYWPLTGTEVSDVDTGEHRKVTLRTGPAPAAVANKGFVYAKDVGGKAELFYRDEDGNEVQITSGGILNSLNLTGIQTVAGVKTFSSIPVLPGSNPATDNEAARKAYVDAHGVVQVVNTQTGAVATGTTLIPNDDTIPQKTEGTEFMSLAITPKNSNNKLKIEVVLFLESGQGNERTVALFQDAIANALAAGSEHNFSGEGHFIAFTHYMTAGTVSVTTFKVRAGAETTGTVTFNGQGGGRKYGGVMASSITITEIKV